MVEAAKNDDTKNSVEEAHGSPVLMNWKSGWRRALKWYVIVFGPITVVAFLRVACIGRYWDGDDGLSMLAFFWTVLLVPAKWLIDVLMTLFDRRLTMTVRLSRCVLLTLSLAILSGGLGYLNSIALLHGISAAASRLDPVVDAADRYVKDHGKAPEDVNELVPRYLDRVPTNVPELYFGASSDPEKPRTLSARFSIGWGGDVHFSTTMDYRRYDYPQLNYTAPRLGRWVLERS